MGRGGPPGGLRTKHPDRGTPGTVRVPSKDSLRAAGGVWLMDPGLWRPRPASCLLMRLMLAWVRVQSCRVRP